jgi:putative ATP-dependent endonuclease of the OLD family
MKLEWIRIQNFRSCRDVTINVNSMHALVGANNAGKSTILRALDFLFNPSTRQIGEETFWNKNTALKIRVEGLFSNLRPHEKDALAAYLRPNDTFHVAREASFTGKDAEPSEDDAEDKIKIIPQYNKPLPKFLWLRDGEINADAIKNWMQDKDSLEVNGHRFSELLGTEKPTIKLWKEKAAEFATKYLTPEDYEDGWVDNPKGYANVLKYNLPFFVLIPAVRDITDESKVSKTNPFGRLVYAVMNAVTQEKRNELDKVLKAVARQLNREGGQDRLAGVRDIETKLNIDIKKIFAECDIELEFQTPTFEVLMASPKMYVDDGFRGLVENKGHGLQRAAIFSILRSYADLVTSLNQESKRSFILGIEEPELYMHPQAQRTVRRVFREIADAGDQVFFSTHSSHFVDVADFDEIIRVEGRLINEGGKKTVITSTWQLPISLMVEDEVARHPKLKGKVTPDSMREYYSHAYDPHRNEGFFARRIVLVEGDTEEYALPIYAEALGMSLDMLGVSVVQCGGKGPMDRLYRIFNELGIPCYMLFDYDKNSEKKEIIEKSKELLSMVGESIEAPSVPVVTDFLACFPEKWEATVNAEIQDFESIQRGARELLGPDAGKPLIARYAARALAAKQPSFVPPTIADILRKAVVVDWRGSCLVNCRAEE